MSLNFTYSVNKEAHTLLYQNFFNLIIFSNMVFFSWVFYLPLKIPSERALSNTTEALTLIKLRTLNKASFLAV